MQAPESKKNEIGEAPPPSSPMDRKRGTGTAVAGNCCEPGNTENAGNTGNTVQDYGNAHIRSAINLLQSSVGIITMADDLFGERRATTCVWGEASLDLLRGSRVPRLPLTARSSLHPRASGPNVGFDSTRQLSLRSLVAAVRKRMPGAVQRKNLRSTKASREPATSREPGGRTAVAVLRGRRFGRFGRFGRWETGAKKEARLERAGFGILGKRFNVWRTGTGDGHRADRTSCVP